MTMNELKEIKSGFTAEERAEFNRRDRVVVVLLSRIESICTELDDLIRERDRDLKSGRRLTRIAWAVLAVMGVLAWVEFLSYKLLFFPGFVIAWNVIRNEIIPDGLNAPRILGLRQIVTPMIIRVEELGISETAVFLWVLATSGLNEEVIGEIRAMYHSSNYSPDRGLSEIGVFLADDDGEYDWEVVKDEGLDAILTRIRVQLAKSVLADSKS